MTDPEPTIRRPLDLALLLLSLGGEPPRQRARDQQADLAGAELRRRVLERLAALDPEPEAIESALAAVIEEFGEPSGPTRGVGSSILQDWESARLVPGFWSWLLAEAVVGRTGRAASGPPPRR